MAARGPSRRGRWAAVAALAVAVVATGAAWALSTGGPHALPYRETFDEPGGGWDEGTTDGGTAASGDGVYRLAVNPQWRLWKAAPVGKVGDAVLIAEAEMAKGKGAYGVWCAGDGGRYEFTVTTDGTAAISRSGSAPTVLAGPARHSAIKAANRLVARCAAGGTGVQLQLWVNGELVSEARDARPRGAGEVGVIAVPGAGGAAEARFGAFEVRAP